MLVIEIQMAVLCDRWELFAVPNVTQNNFPTGQMSVQQYRNNFNAFFWKSLEFRDW